MLWRLYEYFSDLSYVRKVKKKMREAFNGYTQLPEDLTMVFYTALDRGNAATVNEILDKHPEAARSRDWSPPKKPIFRGSQVEHITALICAIPKMPLDTIKRMLELGADVESRAPAYKCSALGLAARSNDIPLMDLLLSYGADPRKITDSGKHLCFDAIHTGSYDAAQKIIDLTGKPDDVLDIFKRMNLLHRFSSYDWKKAVDFMIDNAGMDIEGRHRNGETPLIISVRDGETSKAVEALIARGANVNAVDNLGRTALHWAVTGDNRAGEGDMIVERLLEAGAIPDIVDANGETPQQIALYAIENPEQLYCGIDISVLEKAEEDYTRSRQQKQREENLKKAEQIAKHGIQKPIRLIPRIKGK